jgi:hypothetical protein
MKQNAAIGVTAIIGSGCRCYHCHCEETNLNKGEVVGEKDGRSSRGQR